MGSCSAQLLWGFCGGVWQRLGWGEGGWVVLWTACGGLGGTAIVTTGVRNLSVL